MNDAEINLRLDDLEIGRGKFRICSSNGDDSPKLEAANTKN